MSNVFKAHLKGIFFAITITMVGVLLLAWGLGYFGIGEGMLVSLVQVVKVLSIFVGVMIIARRMNAHAWLHGGLLGIIYTAVTFLILSVIDGSFEIADGFLFETIFAVVIGMFSAMLLRLRKREI